MAASAAFAPGAGWPQIAMVGEYAGGGGLAGQEAVRVHGDGPNIALKTGQGGAGVLVRVSGDRRHVIEGTAAFVIAEE